MKHDLVVFVPGITGTRLTRDGEDLWSPRHWLLDALAFRKASDRLALPDSIGDERPEEPWAVEATELVRTPEMVPGLLSHLGHADIGARRAGLVPEQYVTFPYDWRQSNRLTAKDLAARVQRELDRWRGEVGHFYPRAEDEPKVVLVCHSMGGLIARYYLEVLGGRETARALVTLGTPHRGAAKAVAFLTGHGLAAEDEVRLVRRAKAAAAAPLLNERLATLCRTFPSLGQLLPVYAAVTRPDFPPGYLAYLTDLDVGLPSEMVDDAFDFHDEFDEAVQKNRRNSPDGELPYRMECLGGRGHRTVHGVHVTPEKLTFPFALDDEKLWTGDGVVPEQSAFARWALRRMDEAHWNGHRHGDLTTADAAVHQLAAAIHGTTAEETLADEEFGVVVPDFAVAGEPFEVLATGVAPGRPVTVVLHRPGEQQPTDRAVLTPGEPGEVRGELVAGPGTWVLTVQADHPRFTQREVVLVVEP
ncbi:hypothetical protein [Streptomyces sp. S.PNR 29]|uniref:lipase/acyltransferase domain-containing protein n=1 Tax=Streptomyces sp. S.PNR 29 TaxID=2973805 RepID=UPI0025B0C213|nr:hypothetical protein [Streptomyces sp. S.PNR 29]MDN0194181.1 hypothetical protein [Streptomyces sp. S.PNR 29]